MLKTINFEDVGKINKEVVFVDVRSPKEFHSERIPIAINLPLFNDDERSIIGTVYKNESTEKAREIGVEIVSKKLPDIYKKFRQISKGRKAIVIYCARGGMRSGSIASLLSSLGMDVYKLSGGYKGYRQYVRNNLKEVVQSKTFLVLYGNTGTGKTKILKNLEKEGIGVLDLEACANHRGSVLGSVGQGEMHTQKMFESLVFHNLKDINSKVVVTEGESKRIGRIIMPDYLYDKIIGGVNVKVEASIGTRIENIKEDYLKDEKSKDDILEAIKNLRRYIKEERVEELLYIIKNENYDLAIEKLILDYYDPKYNHREKQYKYELSSDDIDRCSKQMMEIYKRETDKL